VKYNIATVDNIESDTCETEDGNKTFMPDICETTVSDD